MATVTMPIERPDAALKRGVIIALIAFLTLVDLFGAQALLPALAKAYNASPVEVGVAVNASTLGMAMSGLLVALFGHHIDRRRGIWLSLALLSVPTTLLGLVDDLATFSALRVAQGIFMAAAFTLTLSHLSSVCTVTAARGAMAAYITGNVASNFFGRLLASGVASEFGLAETFFVLAGFNLAGALLAYRYFGGSEIAGTQTRVRGDKATTARLFRPELLATFAIGFLILFVFIGVFSYVNFVLAAAPFALDQVSLGYVYAVFIPSILTTPLASAVANRFGTLVAFQIGMIISGIGLAALLSSSLSVVLLGLALAAVGLFFSQAVVTGFVGQAAGSAAARANGLYLTSYYVGGIAGAAVLGTVFEQGGWALTVAVMLASMVLAVLAGLRLRDLTDANLSPPGPRPGALPDQD